MQRREFLKVALGAGGAFWLGISFSGCSPGPVQLMEEEAERSGAFRPNAFLTITPDDRIQVGIGKAEMGQGVVMTHAVLVAEELEVPLEQIEVYNALAGPQWQLFGLQITGGSTSTAEAWVPVRQGAAAAREMLIAAAAEIWGVPPYMCVADAGKVHQPSTQRVLRYGELTAVAARMAIPDGVALKNPSDFKVIGQRHSRRDALPKVTGAPIFGLDVDVPDMARAFVLHPPTFGSRAESIDAEQARAMPGVVDIFPFDLGVAVVAERSWQARRAADAVTVRWSAVPNDRLDTDELLAATIEQSKQPGLVHRDDGDAVAALGAVGAQTLTATYSGPYLAHAPMEPQNATAHVREDGVDIWAPTQFQSGIQGEVADLLGLAREQVRVHTTFMGGAFGRRGVYDVVLEAVLVSRRVGRPVQVVWTREDDTRGGWYRPLMVARLRGALDQAGAVTAVAGHGLSQSLLNLDGVMPTALPTWLPGRIRLAMARATNHLVASGTIPDITATEGLDSFDYDVPNVRVEYTPIQVEVPVTFWRSVGHSFNAFAVESFIDELAHAAGKEPFELRRALLHNNPRKLAVLEEAARLGGWGTPIEDGWGRGIAAHKAFGTYVAEVVEAGVVDGEIVVRKVSCAVDCGIALNPEMVETQMHSGIIFGLSAALRQRIDIKGGRVQQGNFDTYPPLRIHETPVIEVSIIKSDKPPTGVGEPGLPPLAPALANALFAATGKRLRSLPLQDALEEAS